MNIEVEIDETSGEILRAPDVAVAALSREFVPPTREVLERIATLLPTLNEQHDTDK